MNEGPQVVYLYGFASSPRSSKAGYLADRLLGCGVTMLCPDFNGHDFSTLTMTRMLTQLDAEVSTLPPGRMPFFPYGYGEDRVLDVAFYEDSLRYQPMDAVVIQPALIFQGLRDASVDYRTVEQFAKQRPHVRLTLLDEDHSLAASLPAIWEGVRSFVETRR